MPKKEWQEDTRGFVVACGLSATLLCTAENKEYDAEGGEKKLNHIPHSGCCTGERSYVLATFA